MSLAEQKKRMMLQNLEEIDKVLALMDEREGSLIAELEETRAQRAKLKSQRDRFADMIKEQDQ